MVASGAKPRSTSSSSRMPQVSASRCSSRLSKKQKVDLASTPSQDGIARLEDLIEQADEDAGEAVLLVDFAGRSNGTLHDVVHGPQGDPILPRQARRSRRSGFSVCQTGTVTLESLTSYLPA